MKYRGLAIVTVVVAGALCLAGPAAAKDHQPASGKTATVKKKPAAKKAVAAAKKVAPAAKKVKKPARKPVRPAQQNRRAAAHAAAAPTAAALPPASDVQRPLTQPGNYRFTIHVDGLARTYRVQVPTGYAPTQAAPLLLALHGGGIARPSDDGFDGLAREANRHGFLAVFPEVWAGSGKAPGWNAGDCCGDASQQKINDVGFVERVVQTVSGQVNVDRDRLYAVGTSDGGMMAYRLACELPDLFRAVASIGGNDRTTACKPGRAVSVLHIHASDDARVPAALAPLTTAKWAELNRCEPVPRRILEQAGAHCEAYTYCLRQTAVHLCMTDTGGHSWPGAKARPGMPAPSQSLDASSALWGFFHSH